MSIFTNVLLKEIIQIWMKLVVSEVSRVDSFLKENLLESKGEAFEVLNKQTIIRRFNLQKPLNTLVAAHSVYCHFDFFGLFNFRSCFCIENLTKIHVTNLAVYSDFPELCSSKRSVGF